jgi:lincosamide and streptogramin A transport system ATP-binding/permease protein
MSAIHVSKLTFAYDGGENLFEEVSFDIDTSWKLGLVGRNGRGKTTLLNLLLGRYAYQGRIDTDVHFDCFPMEVEDKTRDTLEVLYQIHPGVVFWELEKELNFLQVDSEVLSRPFDTLSNGEQTKILLAALFLKPANFLLIDEPTNHLDQKAREQVRQYLTRQSGFILVSHDRDFLDSCVTHILAINKTGIDVQAGNFSQWWANKERQDSFELAENEKLRKEIRRLNQAAARTANWADKVEADKYRSRERNSGNAVDRGYVGHKSAKMMKRAKNLENRQGAAIESKSQLLKNIETADSLLLRPLAYHKNTLLACAGFEVHSGERIWVRGQNGCGKTTLVRKIMADNPQLTISYIPQDTSFLCGDLDAFASGHALNRSLFLAMLRKLDFGRNLFEKDLGDFSAGQKKKVLLARSLCESAHLYLWDEPLNFIDIFSRKQIEAAVLSCEPTMIFIEHDIAFGENVATKTVEIGKSGHGREQPDLSLPESGLRPQKWMAGMDGVPPAYT